MNNHERLLVCGTQKMTFHNIGLKGFSPVKLVKRKGFSPVWTWKMSLQNASSPEVHRAKFAQVSSLGCVKSEMYL